MGHVIAFSDIHLGDEHTLLYTREHCQTFAEQIRAMVNNEPVDCCVMNGDIFEAAIPQPATPDQLALLDPPVPEVDGIPLYPPLVVFQARQFFEALLSTLTIETLVWVPGNHDLALWAQVVHDLQRRQLWTRDNHRGLLIQARPGQLAPGAEQFVSTIIGGAAARVGRIRVAYPNYRIGKEWPYLIFHHGHLMDELILGEKFPGLYAGLFPLTGTGMPLVRKNAQLEEIADATSDFVVGLWQMNGDPANIRREFWQYLRRHSSPQNCIFYPDDIGQQEVDCSPGKAGKFARWYCERLLMDDDMPLPVGEFGGTPDGDRSALPSYVLVGHSHHGEVTMCTDDSSRFEIFNTGGWIKDQSREKPYAYVLHVPDEGARPQMSCLRVEEEGE